MKRPFCMVDVFGSVPFGGNPVAVVLDATDMTTDDMQRFTRWMNLSESTFVLPPEDPSADYRVRIFTLTQELPFAGHPTLGTCHAWLGAGGVPHQPGVIVQECGAGLVNIRQTGDGLAFAAPPLLRDGPVDEELTEHLAELLRIDRSEIVDAAWADNGPGWVAVLLRDAEAVLALKPGIVDVDLGVVGPHNGATVEDPVTGSLNASLASWLLSSGRAQAPYVAAQGTALGRAGRAHISVDDGGQIWVAGNTVSWVVGETG
jgi:PhzF family phenazine biosynthesis protein